MITTSASELRHALPDGGALMGLDPGTKTIGVAQIPLGACVEIELIAELV